MGLWNWMEKKSAQKAFSNINRTFPRFVDQCEWVCEKLGKNLDAPSLLKIMKNDYHWLLLHMTHHPDLQRGMIEILERYMSDDYFRLELNPCTQALIRILYENVKNYENPIYSK